MTPGVVNQMSDIFLVIFFVSIFIGLKKPSMVVLQA